MRGDIKLKSNEGVGTEVTFNLSCEFDPSSFEKKTPTFQNKSAAIIDRSVIGGKSLINMLESIGFDSFQVAKGISSEFLNSLIEYPVDLLFVDSSFFTPLTEVLLDKLKEKTSTKVVLSVPKLFPSLENKCIDITTPKPFKKSNIIWTVTDLLSDDATDLLSKGAMDANNHFNSSFTKKPVFDEQFALSAPLKILVAEDHKINQMLIKKILNKLGYNPKIVGNGRLAIEASLNESFDVIFMDIQMPVLDGVAATKEILKDWAAHKEVFIIAMTANAMKGDRENYIAAGMHDYISKPFLINDLQDLLVKYSIKKNDQLNEGNQQELSGS